MALIELEIESDTLTSCHEVAFSEAVEYVAVSGMTGEIERHCSAPVCLQTLIFVVWRYAREKMYT